MRRRLGAQSLATLTSPHSLRPRTGKTLIRADLDAWPRAAHAARGGHHRSQQPGYAAAETQTGKTLLGFYMAQRFLTGGLLFGIRHHARADGVAPTRRPDRRVQERVRDVQQEFARAFPVSRLIASAWCSVSCLASR